MTTIPESALLEEQDLLAAKLKCLEFALAMWRAPDNCASATAIVEDATKFWNFLLGEEGQSETSA